MANIVWIYKYFFTQLIIKLWNSLPRDVTEDKSLAGFKTGLDIYVDDTIIWCFNSKY